jgi:hypothetical protein
MFLGRLDDLQVLWLGEALDELLVVGGDGSEVGRGQWGRPAFLLKEATDRGGVLQDRNDGVEEDAIEAGGIEANGQLRVFDEGVPGEPRGLGVGIRLR